MKSLVSANIRTRGSDKFFRATGFASYPEKHLSKANIYSSRLEWRRIGDRITDKQHEKETTSFYGKGWFHLLHMTHSNVVAK